MLKSVPSNIMAIIPLAAAAAAEPKHLMRRRWRRVSGRCQLARCGREPSARSPALRQSVVAEMQDELVQRVRLLPLLLFLLFLHFGLSFLEGGTRQRDELFLQLSGGS